MDKKEALYSEDIEKSVISCLATLDECKKHIKKLDTQDFAISIHQIIFGIIKSLYSKEQTIDLISIKEKAKEIGEKADKIFEYLVKISDLSYTSRNIESYIQTLKTYTTKRKIIKQTREIQDYIYTSRVEIDSSELKKESIKKIADIEVSKTNIEKEEMKYVILESMRSIEERYIKRDDNTYKTGFWDLDKITDGLHEQEFTIIAARPRMWKNSICSKYSREYCKKRSTNILCKLRNVRKATRE